MNSRSPSEGMYQVRGTLIEREQFGCSGIFSTIFLARNSPALLPPSLP